MANEEHLALLKGRVQDWNKWRQENVPITPDLSGANLSEVNLSEVNLSRANLSGAVLSKAVLSKANLSEANLSEANLSGAYLTGVDLTGATLYKADLRKTALHKATLVDAILTKADLSEANLSGVDLSGAYLTGATLHKANFIQANLSEANFTEANLSEAILLQAILVGAILHGADLSGATLSRTTLYRADLTEANLTGAILTGAQLIETNLTDATLTGCHIYGISAWKLTLKGTTQRDLIITNDDETVITVDNLEVAQFIYLLLNNKKIRDVIDTITSKVVLILGRFTDKRKPLLDALREALRQRGFVPILSDFPPSARRDLTETIQLLANMAKFVIADITEAKSIPQELSHIIPLLPSVPVQPILLASEQAYAVYEHWPRFNSVLPEFLYTDERHLIENLDVKVIEPVNIWQKEQDTVTVLLEEKRKAEEKIRELEAKLAQKEQQRV